MNPHDPYTPITRFTGKQTHRKKHVCRHLVHASASKPGKKDGMAYSEHPTWSQISADNPGIVVPTVLALPETLGSLEVRSTIPVVHKETGLPTLLCTNFHELHKLS